MRLWKCVSQSLLMILYISSDQYVNVKPNLRCLHCILNLSVCLVDAGSGSLMVVAPCGHAAAGRLDWSCRFKESRPAGEGATACFFTVQIRGFVCGVLGLHKKRKKEISVCQIWLKWRNSSRLYHCPSVFKPRMICNLILSSLSQIPYSQVSLYTLLL